MSDGAYIRGLIDGSGIDELAVRVKADLPAATFSRYVNDKRPIPERHRVRILIAIGATQADKQRAARRTPSGSERT